MAQDVSPDLTLEAVAQAICANADDIRQRGVTAVFVYGSRSRGDHRHDSDLDVFVEYDPNSQFNLLKLARVRLLIEKATGLDVHITTANSIPAASMTSIAGDAVKVL